MMIDDQTSTSPKFKQRVYDFLGKTYTTIPNWLPVIVVILAAILYSKAAMNDFTYWDDDLYILKNQFLRNFSLKGITAIFTTFDNANYHPLTTITNLFEYRFFKLNPLPYHLTNILLHLLNIWLVFKLTERLSGKRLTALIVCILFAIHPLNVESVAWISERKNVLYSSFYLMSLLAYLRYIAQGFQKSQYVYALLLFLASLFSKSAAVTLPVLLIVIDIYKGRKITIKSLLEKLPFFILSVLFGILAFMSQKAGGGMHELSNSFNFINRIFLFTSRIAFYIIELLVPIKLCVLHGLPEAPDNVLPWYYYCSLPLLLLLATAIVFAKKPYRKETLFGIAFFFVTISVMLQITNVGYSLTAERYTYIPYIGLFYIVGQVIASLTTKSRSYAIAILSLLAIGFSIITWNRISVWKDTDTLVSDVLEKNPDNPYDCFAFNANGDSKADAGDLRGALDDYSNAISLFPEYEEEYNKRGVIYDQLGDLPHALSDFNKAVQINPNQASNYNNRGLANEKSGNKKAALSDFNQAIELGAATAEIYNSRGNAYYETGDLNAALADFNKSIELNAVFMKPYYNRATIKARTGQLNEALEDYGTILKYHPNDSVVYFNEGVIHLSMKDSAAACKDWAQSMALGYQKAAMMLQQFCH